MRLPYTVHPSPPGTTTAPPSEEEEAIVARIAARRAPRPLQPLDLALLHAPPVADGWSSFLGAVRGRTTLAADVRELCVCRVAAVNAAWYEWAHHAPLLVAAGVEGKVVRGVVGREGVLCWDEEEEEEEDKKGEAKGGDEGKSSGKEGQEEEKNPKRGRRPGGLNERQWAALMLTDEMTRNVQVKDETFERVKGLFSEREVVELVATIACYNCVSRFLVALDVGEKNGSGPDVQLEH